MQSMDQIVLAIRTVWRNPRPRALAKVNIIPADIYLRVIRFVQ